MEKIVVSCNGIETVRDLICSQFIDQDTLYKCDNWLKEYWNQFRDEHKLFQRITLNTIQNELNFKSENKTKDENNIKCHFPIKDFWGNRDIDEIIKSIQEYELPVGKIKKQEMPAAKPRGKQMDIKASTLNERPFICSFSNCNRAFKRHEHLKRHIKMHTGEKPFKCHFPDCDRSFSRSDNLNAHYKTHGSATKSSIKSFKVFENTYERY